MPGWMDSWSWKQKIAVTVVCAMLALGAWFLALDLFRCDVTTVTYTCTFEGIGDFPGGNYRCNDVDPTFCSGAYGVSQDGLRVVGHGTVDDFDSTHTESRMAAGWTSLAGTIGFWGPANPPGLLELGYGSAPGDTDHHSFAAGISDDGQVVVGSVLNGGVQKPARWIAGVVATLKPANGDLGGEALKASSDGKIIVGYTIPGATLPKGDNWSTPRQAVRWRHWAGSYQLMLLQDSGDSVTTNSSRANGVSGSGERIAGVVYDESQAPGSQVKYPALWWRNLPPSLPPPQAGPPFQLLILRDENGNIAPGEATAISADGGVVVGTMGVYPNQYSCYWYVSPVSPPIKANRIALLPDDCNSSATCVSNVGSLRVYGARSWKGTTPDCEYEGDNVGSFAWDLTQGAQDLVAYMNTNGAVPAGWMIEQVTAVSTDGLTIVGTGSNNGVTEGWVYKCLRVVTTTERWCLRKKHSPEIPPETPAPPPIDPLRR